MVRKIGGSDRCIQIAIGDVGITERAVPGCRSLAIKDRSS
jgi:hypothetical protein